MKCFSKLTYAMAAYVDDLDFGFKIAQRATEYGVDGFSTPQILAFARGTLRSRHFDRQGFRGLSKGQRGEVLLAARPDWSGGKESGTCWPTARTGRHGGSATGAEEFAHNTIKKHEQLPLKLGMLDPLYFLMYSTNEKISITQIEGKLAPGAFCHARGTGSVRQGLAAGSQRKIQAVLSGLGTARRKVRYPITRLPKWPAKSSTGWRRCTTSTTPSALRRHGFVLPEAAVSHPQLSETDLGGDGDRYGRSRD